MAEEEAEEVLAEDQIRDFIVAAHGNLPRVREMLIKHPGLLNARHYWSESDSETAIQAAAQTGSVPVVEYLLERGAPLDICTAAMLGRKDDVQRMLDEDPRRIEARGAHGIPLMPHAALGGNVQLAKMLYARGATTGTSHALGNAVMHGDARMARWLLENAKPDLSWKSYEGKGLLTIAKETGKQEMLTLLREYGIQ
ncbi:MAG: ankyrin repeat domain-containing protein [Chloroflexota bacterium]